jgi:hypothetical protein
MPTGASRASGARRIENRKRGDFDRWIVEQKPNIGKCRRLKCRRLKIIDRAAAPD